jgi:hypothetical protein
VALCGRMTPDREPIDVRLRLDVREVLLYALLPAAITLGGSLRLLPHVRTGGLIDPDSYMRLVRLEDGLRHHDIAYVVAGDGSGGGTLLHWSHLLDTFLLLLAIPFRLFMDTHSALHAAAVVFGPICMGTLGVALAWAVTPLANRSWLWLTPVAASLSTAIASYGLLGVAHHHVPLLTVAAMVCGYAVRGALGLARGGDGLAMGVWAAVGIWLSPESMPFTLIGFGGLWLAWLLVPRSGLAPMIAETAAAFAIVVIVAFLTDPPYAGYGSVEIDRLSIVYIGLAIAIACIGCAAMMFERAGQVRVVTGIAVPVICLASWLVCFPTVLRGPSGLMSPKDAHAMLDVIVEMMPVHGIVESAEYLLTGSLAAVWLVWVAIVHRSPLLGYVAVCAGLLVALGAMHVRFSAYSAALGAAMLPILIARCTAYLSEWSDTSQGIVRVCIIATFVLLPCGMALPSAHASTGAAAPSCSLSGGATLLADHAGQVVLADPSDSPELLYRTHVLTVGSLYHRNVAAFMRLRTAWRSAPSDAVPAAVRATDAVLVLFCPSPARSKLIADLPPNTLLDQLNQGHTPPWLDKLSEDRRSGYVLYEVMP